MILVRTMATSKITEFINKQIYPTDQDLTNNMEILLGVSINKQLLYKKNKDSATFFVVLLLDILNFTIEITNFFKEEVFFIIQTTNFFVANNFGEYLYESISNIMDMRIDKIVSKADFEDLEENSNIIGLKNDKFALGLCLKKKIKENEKMLLIAIKQTFINLILCLSKNNFYMLANYKSFFLTGDIKTLKIGITIALLNLFQKFEKFTLIIKLFKEFIALILVLGDFKITITIKNNNIYIDIKCSFAESIQDPDAKKTIHIY